MAASISAFLSTPGTEYDYDFHLLSLAVSLVYAYGLALPVLLWVALRYLGVGEWSVVEALAVWGYAMFVWVPVSVSQFCPVYPSRLIFQILCVIPVPIVRWVLVLVAFGTSGYFLIVNIYPILATVSTPFYEMIILF